MAAGKSALIIGSTGQTGRHVLKELLNSPQFTRVGEYGRKVTDLATLPAGKEKLEQKVIDYEKLNESGLKNGEWDVVFITLGTSRKNAGSAEAFVRIDREYVVNAAREAKSAFKPQRLVYCSSNGANPKAPFLYPQSKGLTERDLASLGYDDTIIFRPGLLADTQRNDPRFAESAFGAVISAINRVYEVKSKMQISVATLGLSMVKAGILGTSQLPSVAKATRESWDKETFTVIGNSGATALAAEEKAA